MDAARSLIYTKGVNRNLRSDKGTIILANEPRLLRELLANSFNIFWGNEVALQMTVAGQLPETIDRYHPAWVIVTLETLGDAALVIRGKTSSLNMIGLARDGQVAVVRRAVGDEETQVNLTLNMLYTILESV